MKLNKQFELGASDLFSLEPVDKNNRPLRIKSYIRDSDLLSKMGADEIDKDDNELQMNMKAALGIMDKNSKLGDQEL